MFRIRAFISKNARRFLLSVSLAVAAGFLVAGGRFAQSEAAMTHVPGFTWSELRDIYQQEDELNERVHGLAVYQEELDRIKRDVLRAGLPLEAAVDAAIAIASETRPTIINVPAHRADALPVARMAVLLLHSLAQDCRAGQLAPEDRQIVSCLCEELKSWERLDAGTMADLIAQLR